MVRITRDDVSKKLGALNDALRRRDMDYRYNVVSENGKLTLERESPTHVHLDQSIQVGLSTREMYLVLKAMHRVICDNTISEHS